MSQTLSNVTYPVFNTSKNASIRTKTFGDTLYKDYTLDGINYNQEIWDVSWKPMISSKAISLENILIDSKHGTSNYLLWQGIGEDSANYYIAKNISRSILGPNLVQISAKLERIYPSND